MNKVIKVATNIKWDVDDIRDLKDLPLYMEIPDDIADDEDRISDYLSEQTGFCHYGFNLTSKNKVEGWDRSGYCRFPMTEEDIKKNSYEIYELRASINDDYYLEVEFSWGLAPLSACNTIVEYLQYLDTEQILNFMDFLREGSYAKIWGRLPIFKKVKLNEEIASRVIDYLKSNIGEYYRKTIIEHLKNEIDLEMCQFEDDFKKVLNKEGPKGEFFLELINEASIICDIFKYLKKSLDSMFISDLEMLAFTEGRQPIAILYSEFKKENIKLEYSDSNLEIVAIKNNQKRED